MLIQFYNKHNFDINKQNIQLLEKSFELIKQEFNLKENFYVELNILTDSEIKNINKEYRNIDKATDVLSFSFIENIDLDKEKTLKILHNLIGVIYISYDQISKFSSKSFEYNFLFLFSHGLLHILGFDHGNRMSELEQKIVEKVFDF